MTAHLCDCGQMVGLTTSWGAPRYHMKPHDCSVYCGSPKAGNGACCLIPAAGRCHLHGGERKSSPSQREANRQRRWQAEERYRAERTAQAYERYFAGLDAYAQRIVISRWFDEGGGGEAFDRFAAMSHKAQVTTSM